MEMYALSLNLQRIVAHVTGASEKQTLNLSGCNGHILHLFGIHCWYFDLNTSCHCH